MSIPIKGNWSEGLTTYLADHLYEEQKGLGFKYRKDLLIDYQSYVNDRNEFPLKDFQARTDFASKAIGYGKAAMVFHMLKTRIGERAFYDSLKIFTAEMRFKKASWEDLQRAFEKNSAKDLSWFFNQWTDRRGLLELQVEDVKIIPREGKFEVHFVITQKKGIYEADLPVVFYSAAGKTRNVFHIDKEKNSLTVLLDDIPSRVVVDEDYDIARRLTPGEFPPVIARLIGDEEKMIALPPSGAGVYETCDRYIAEERGRGSGVQGYNRCGPPVFLLDHSGCPKSPGGKTLRNDQRGRGFYHHHQRKSMEFPQGGGDHPGPIERGGRCGLRQNLPLRKIYPFIF